MKINTRLNGNTITRILPVTVLACTLSFSALAQDKKEKTAPPPSPPRPMAMPMRPPQVDTAAIPEKAKKLYAFLGMWNGTIDAVMDGKKMQMKAMHRYSKIADGWGVRMDENMDMGETGRYNGMSLFGYDAGEDMYHVYTVDNMGSVHDHKGKWDGDKISLEHTGKKDGKSYVEKIWIEIKSPTEYSMKLEATLDGKMVEQGEGTMTKNQPPARPTGMGMPSPLGQPQSAPVPPSAPSQPEKK